MAKKAVSKSNSKKVVEVRVKRKYTKRAKKVEEIKTENYIKGDDNNMTELLKALTDLAKEATVYLAKKNGSLADKVAEVVSEVAKEEKVATEEPAKRTRRTKAEIAAAEDPMSALGLPEEKVAPVLTEKESKDLLLATATAYIAKFGKPVGAEKAKGYLKAYKVEKITDLDHPQRLTFVETLNKDLVAA